MRRLTKYLPLLGFLLLSQFAAAQDSLRVQTRDSLTVAAADSTLPDSTKRTLHTRIFGYEKNWPRPKRAALLALAPGVGQIYNKSYWKAPIVYAALGTCTFFVVINQQNFAEFRDAYRLRLDGDATTTDKYVGVYSDASLRTLRNYYRRNRDFSIIIGVAMYGLSIMEAYVDAHLKHFTVSESLTLHLKPIQPLCGGRGVGAGLALYIR